MHRDTTQAVATAVRREVDEMKEGEGERQRPVGWANSRSVFA